MVKKKVERHFQIIPFSAFWLRSSVVSVLISLIFDMWVIGRKSTKIACIWAFASRPCVALLHGLAPITVYLLPSSSCQTLWGN
ncbi:hypothetical protein BRARA_E01402, partial [Brassica rapa]